jgi:dTMP kinase
VNGLRGKFVVLDGGEGCGKSTQTELLRQVVESAGVPVLAVRDPGATRVGEQIRQILLNPEHTELGMRAEMLLYMAARAQMMKQLILPALEAGKFVLSDRFVSSTLAYQLDGDGLTAAEIRAVADIAVSLRWPDRIILLDMPPSESGQRIQRPKDRIEQRPPEYHLRVRRNFLAQAAADPARYRVISAAAEKSAVHAAILAALKDLA